MSTVVSSILASQLPRRVENTAQTLAQLAACPLNVNRHCTATTVAYIRKTIKMYLQVHN